ncbi:MAG TPA: glycosyltransferase N-terminal domain-containing protein [Chthoniobacterales bacterium]
MIRFIYNLLFPFALLAFLPGYVRKMRRRGNYRPNFEQRFGVYAPELRARFAAQRHTWIHAVSVGEVAIALKLAGKLRDLDAEFRCVLTTTTTTGFATAQTNAPEWMTVMYNPIDYWLIVRRAFEAIRPQRIVLVEAEVWPNLAAEARARGVSLSLVNARLSDRSERRFRRFARFVRPTFRCLDLVCVQEARDVARWQALGVRREAIRHTGSIKYDPTENQMASEIATEVLDAIGLSHSQPILLAGSTHAGEEEIVARALLRMREKLPHVFAIVAPRHVERADEILGVLHSLGLRVTRRTAVTADPTDILLLDTTGELRHWYAAATVVFVGKSLTTNGGQNPVEAILAGKPVIFGPHMENFATLARALVEREAAIQITRADELAPACLELFRDPHRREAFVRRAREVLAPHHGATERTAELLLGARFRAASAKSLATHKGTSDIARAS